MTPSCFSRRGGSKFILFTSKGQGKNLASGHEVTQVGHVAYHPMRLGERNAVRPTARLYFSSIKSYWKKNYSLLEIAS